MKIKLIIGVLALLLLLTGCRGLKEASSPDNNTATTPSVSSVAEVPASTPTPSVEDVGITPSPQSGQSSGSVSVSAEPPNSVPPSDGLPPSTAVTSQTPAAPKSEVNAVLDDIIKELGDLDELYSQLDDVQDSDLSD